MDMRTPIYASPSQRAKSLASSAAQHAGKRFEECITLSCAGVVALFKIPSGARWIGKGRHVAVASPFDFAGCFVGSGRMLAFDAKCCGTAEAGLAVNSPGKVEPHQKAHLAALAEAGAVAGFLVRAERVGLYLWLSANRLACERGETIRWDDARWTVLGMTQSGVDFAKLAAAYGVVP